jgi:hypothetical protein
MTTPIVGGESAAASSSAKDLLAPLGGVVERAHSSLIGYEKTFKTSVDTILSHVRTLDQELLKADPNADGITLGKVYNPQMIMTEWRVLYLFRFDLTRFSKRVTVVTVQRR